MVWIWFLSLLCVFCFFVFLGEVRELWLGSGLWNVIDMCD